MLDDASVSLRFGLLFVVGLLVLMEAAYLIRRRQKSYPWGDAAASFGVSAIKRVSDVAFAGIAASILFWIYEHRLATIQIDGLISLVALFLSVEFFYYWFHRYAHEVRWFWASHSVHHSSQNMNLSVAGRLSTTSLISGSFLFFSPLVLIGFNPIAVYVTLVIGLLYQFWVHTEVIESLGWFDRIFNSPANHRVHHSSDPEYLDKNYGGVLMVFDQLFGSYAAEEKGKVMQYGLVKPVNSKNPITIMFAEWVRLCRDVFGARSMADVSGYVFGKPGWTPEQSDCSSETAVRTPKL